MLLRIPHAGENSDWTEDLLSLQCLCLVVLMGLRLKVRLIYLGSKRVPTVASKFVPAKPGDIVMPKRGDEPTASVCAVCMTCSGCK